MTAVHILEGLDTYSSGGYRGMPRDVELLGWPKLLRPSSYKKAIRKVARPITRFTRPISRPLDRVLKKIPVVRTAYRASITSQYALRGRFKKAWGAAKRTGRSAMKDFSGAKKILTKIAIKVVTPLARSGMSKTVAKLTAVPPVAAKAGAMFGPWAIPLAGVSVNEAINRVWKKIKGVALRMTRRVTQKSLKSLSRNIGGGSPLAKKMSFVPEVPPSPAVRIPGVAMAAAPAPASKAPMLLLLAIPAALALLS